jgi:hypothetical protein
MYAACRLTLRFVDSSVFQEIGETDTVYNMKEGLIKHGNAPGICYILPPLSAAFPACKKLEEAV